MGPFYSCFSTAYKTDIQKHIPKEQVDFLILHFVIDIRLIGNWTLCRTIQRYALDQFKITRPITP